MFAFYVIIMRTYFQTNIPEEIKEAAEIDGASGFKILKIAIASVGAVPVMVLLPFFQKYYVKGLRVGSVKD